jgi:hypothetical protein
VRTYRSCEYYERMCCLVDEVGQMLCKAAATRNGDSHDRHYVLVGDHDNRRWRFLCFYQVSELKRCKSVQSMLNS